MNSVNNKLILEPYKGTKKLEMEVKSGFGTIKAKSSLLGLKLVEDALVSVSTKEINTIKKGTVLFFREETLSTVVAYKTVYELNDNTVVIGNFQDVVCVGN